MIRKKRMLYYYTDTHNDIFFGENSVKKFSNIKTNTNKGNDDNKIKNEIKEDDKNSKNNNNNNNQILENHNFGLGEDENNYGGMLNETDGFDKLLNQLKKEKIEDDKNYEKERAKEKEKAKAKEKEKEKEKNKYNNDVYDINNLVDNDNDNTKDNNNLFSDNIFGGGKMKKNNTISSNNNDNNNYKFKYSNNKKTEVEYNNSDYKDNKQKSGQNRRGNARQFLEDYENSYNNEINTNINSNKNNINNLMYSFGSNDFSISKTKTYNDVGNNDFNNFGINDNGTIGSLFGKGSRRRHDKNYEI